VSVQKIYVLELTAWIEVSGSSAEEEGEEVVVSVVRFLGRMICELNRYSSSSS
jgi:hypothetical protein